MRQPIVEPSNPTRLDTRQYLASLGDTERDNPDDTPLDEAVQLIKRFKRDSEESSLRTKAMRWWRKCDRFVEGDQWPLEDNRTEPWQARLTINKLHKIREKWLSLLMKNIPKVEFLPRDPAHVFAADALDGYFEHEWDRNKWTTVVGVAMKQAITHGIGWIKVTWDAHGDGGRGNVMLQAVSNYDLFLDEHATIRNGKLFCKYAIHQFDLTRNKILSIYEEDPGGTVPSTAEVITARENGKPPMSRFERYVDGLRTGQSTHGSSGAGSVDRPEGHPDRADKKNTDNYLVNECLYFDDSRVEGPEVDDSDMPIPPLAYPNGRIMTETNGKLLYDKPNALGFNMYVPFSLSPDVERIYNPSIIYHCISPQEELNKRRSQIADHAALTGNPILVIRQTANVDQNFVPHPGAVVVSADGLSDDAGISYLQAPQMSPEVVQSSVMSEQSIEEISGHAELQRGSLPNDLESGVGVDLVQQSAETVPQMYTMFLDDNVRTLCENISSCFLDFTAAERKYRFLDTRALKTTYQSFDPNEWLLPSRNEAVMMVEQEIGVFLEQLALAQMQMNAEEYAIFEQRVQQEIAIREQEMEQIWNLPASDLISFDVQIKVGTRDISKVQQQSLSLQLHEQDAITTPRMMRDLEYHDWMLAWEEKQMELQQRAEAEQAALQEQVALERTIDEDEHEQEIEIEKLKGKYQIEVAEIRARATQKRATQSKSK